MSVPYDQRLANEAAAVDQCIKLGGVVLSSKPRMGFGIPAPGTVPSLPQSIFNMEKDR